MHAQPLLPFDETDGEEPLEPLWDCIPERQRDELLVLLARVISRAARSSATSDDKELSHEESTC